MSRETLERVLASENHEGFIPLSEAKVRKCRALAKPLQDNLPLHPLIDLIVAYCEEYPKLRDACESVENLAFHNEYGLKISCPLQWPLLNAIGRSMNHTAGKYMILYDSTRRYDEIQKVLIEETQGISGMGGVMYMSWHEIASAIQINSEDVRPLKYVRDSLANADYVFFVGADRALKQVVATVKGYTNGCLVMLQ